MPEYFSALGTKEIIAVLSSFCVIAFYSWRYFAEKRHDKKPEPTAGSTTVTNQNNSSAVVNIYDRPLTSVSTGPQTVGGLAPNFSAASVESKAKTDILFIDDDTKFKVVGILRKAGWSRVNIVRDATNLDMPEIVCADVIFVDIQGVGLQMHFQDQGLGLVRALKERHPKKKICVYSAENSGDRFHEGLTSADARLRKTADPYEFIRTIERLIADR